MLKSKLKILYSIFFIHLLAIPILLYWVFASYDNDLFQSIKVMEENLMEKIKEEIKLNLANSNKMKIDEIAKKIIEKYNFSQINIYNKKENLITSKVKDKSKKNGKGSYISLKIHLKNDALCQNCHLKNDNYLGFVEAKVSIDKSMKFLGQKKVKVIIFISFILILIIGIISFFNYYFFSKPIKKLINGMEKVKSGNLDFRVEIKREDEIGLLISYFNELVLSLKKAKMELEEAHKKEMERAEQLALVGEIASGIAHEVKNPLAGISSALEVLSKELKKDSEEMEIINQIYEEVKRILNILNQLLDYAKPKPPNPIEFSIEDFLKDLNTMFSLTLKKKNANFITNIYGENFTLFLDPNILKQILLNVLQNSFQAISNNGKIILNVYIEENIIRFEVIDDGCGISEEKINKIFQPFFTTKVGGTGLGLAIVKRKVEEMNGKISIFSELNKGTKVIIELPRKI